jgi:hypothetical protein
MPRTKLLKHISLIAIPILSVSLGLVGAALRGRAASDNSQLEVELVTLRPAGFEPAEITRPKGPFVLFIDDRSGTESSSLVLKRMNNERLRAIILGRKKSDWHDVLDFAPGTYLLQDAANSELRCQITILP